jgi:hypothetical protein
VQFNFPEELSGLAQDQYHDERNLIAVALVHGRPLGEILQALHNHFLSCKRSHDFHFSFRDYVNLDNWATWVSLTVHTGVSI